MSGAAEAAPEFAPGEVVEVRCEAGLRYLHVTHAHPSYPPVVRLLPGVFAARPDLEALVRDGGGRVAMVPLRAALARLGVAAGVAGRVAVEEPFPWFRMPVRDRAGAVVYWWLWDGETLRHVGDLSAAEAALPLREVMGSAALGAALEA